MARRIFIFGAGASSSSGLPLMTEFIDAADDLRSSTEGADRADFELVFDLIQNRLPRLHAKSVVDLNNIESVFSLLEMGRLVQRLPGTPSDQINATASAIRRVLIETVEGTCEFELKQGQLIPPSGYLTIAGLVDPHVRPQGSPETAFITFNYDIAFDLALHWSGVRIDYAVGDSVARGSVPLLKLHGSVNWGVCPTCRTIVPVNIDRIVPSIRDRDRAVLPPRIPLNARRALAQLGSHCTGSTIPDLAAVVPPSWNKTQYHETFAKIWRQGAQELSHAEDIIVVGYSLPQSDAFFRDLLALGLVGETRVRKFTVVDPSNETANRFRELLGPDAQGRFMHVAKTFEKYCEDELPSNPRSR